VNEGTVNEGASRRSGIGTIALGLAALSALGLVVLIVGQIAGIEGAREGEQSVLVFDIAWLIFFVAGVATLITGLIALFLGRRDSKGPTARAGMIALAYVVLAVVVVLIAS
jgi:hypothetical protein